MARHRRSVFSFSFLEVPRDRTAWRWTARTISSLPTREWEPFGYSAVLANLSIGFDRAKDCSRPTWPTEVPTTRTSTSLNPRADAFWSHAFLLRDGQWFRINKELPG